MNQASLLAEIPWMIKIDKTPEMVSFVLTFNHLEFCTFEAFHVMFDFWTRRLDSDLTSLGERILEIFPQSVHKPAQCEFKPQIDGDKKERYLLIDSNRTMYVASHYKMPCCCMFAS